MKNCYKVTINGSKTECHYFKYLTSAYEFMREGMVNFGRHEDLIPPFAYVLKVVHNLGYWTERVWKIEKILFEDAEEE